ncbi:hypothetical protein MBLNU457_2003t2 [Dothideomycetes sp. NU457]
MRPAGINQSTAAALTVFYTIFFVAPFYLSKSLRVNTRVNRNSPASIKARARSVFWVSVTCTVITAAVLAIYGRANLLEVLRLLGLFPINLFDVIRSLLLTAILFAGPLFEEGIVEGNWRAWLSIGSFKREVIDNLVTFRALVVGPVSEEIVFRSLAVSLYLLANVEPSEIVFKTPLIFGLAHLHHLHETIVRHQKPDKSYLATAMTPSVLLSGLLQITFQFAYTSLFGIFATFLYLRTGNVYGCILVHSFCNYMGFPRVWGRLGQVAAEESGSVEQSLGVEWTVAYYALLFGGAYGFYKLLWPLTESSYALASF